MNEQFNRVYKVTAYRQQAASNDYFETLPNGVEITSMRMTCKVQKTLKSEPNPCELTLSNLSERSRAEFERMPLRVKIDAGYASTGARLLFVGDVRPGFAHSKIEGPDWNTTVNLGDGIRAFAEARVSKSYKPGTPAINILRDVARTMNMLLPREIEADSKLKQPLPASETAFGWSADEFTRLLAPYGYSWSSQNGSLQLTRDDFVPNGTEREIGEHTGMLGSPDYGNPEKNGKPPSVTVRHLLAPEIMPGHKMRLISAGTTKSYKIIRVSHSLDTHGDDWSTEIEGKPL